MNDIANGVVYFIGAGPGDPGLLTVRGHQLLNSADLVIYDRLVSGQILSSLPEGITKVCAESLPGCHPERMVSLVDLMLSNAKKGLKVARLKGGDPLLFGRGSEEIEPLLANNIPFEIVPGVTAALGASAYAGIPLTHREFSSAVAFITGHEKDGKTGSFLDWNEIAKFPGTLVFYMGVKRALVIQSNLIKQGMSDQTPVSIISNATLPNQKQVSTNLSSLASVIQKEMFEPPAIIIIGAAAKFLGLWDWRNKLPLGNASVLISRPKGQSLEFSTKLRNLGAHVLQFDSMEIIGPESWNLVDQEIHNLSAYDWLVFTSSNGVEKFFNRFFDLDYDIRTLAKIKIACIGPSTALALRQFHLKADLIPEKYDAEGLLGALLPMVKGAKILLARAKEGRNLIPQELSKACEITDIHVYSQKKPSPDQILFTQQAISSQHIDYVAVTSSNSAKLLVESLGSQLEAGIRSGKTKIIAISPLTGEELLLAGWNNIICAKEFTANGIVNEMVSDWAKKSLLKRLDVTLT